MTATILQPAQLSTTQQEQRFMKFRETEIDTGIRAALAIEAAGGWKEFDPSSHLASVGDDQVEQVMVELRRYRGPADMPPDPRHLRLLIDAAAYLNNEKNRAAGWLINGIDPTIGRRMLNGSREVFWSGFFTAYCFGLGLSTYDQPEDYLRDQG
ncbi:hypothetical protein [Paracoccus sp. T5]|mgnify:CR=1 FL=1|uniref:hypothetical protein n=1 Tax=Paracoccus sp. T5 TaxID=3402161 RepID=UPI003AEE6431